MAAYYSRHICCYITKQIFSVALELTAITFCIIFMAAEYKQQCYDDTGENITHYYLKAITLLTVCHLYHLFKIVYFSWSLYRKQRQSILKCCLQCGCCYTVAIYIYAQVVFFRYQRFCHDQIPIINFYLLLETALFYFYAFLECCTVFWIGVGTYYDKKNDTLQIEKQKKKFEEKN